LSPRLRSIAIAGLLALATFTLYWLGTASGTAGPHQAGILNQATKARDFPLFFRDDVAGWLQPVPVYFAAVLGRSATLLIGAINVGLLYAVATRLFMKGGLAVCAALILALTPVHAQYSQSPDQAIYSLPFVLGWLLCVLSFLDVQRVGRLFASGLCLGVGIYTQPAAPITMAALLLLTLAALGVEGHKRLKPYVIVIVGFVLPMLPMVPWFAIYPETYPDTMGAWAIQKAHVRFPLDGIRAFLNWNTLSSRVSIYWGTLNPSFLFFRSETMPASGLASPPFLFSVAVLAPVGIGRALTSMRPSIALLLVGGVLTAPLAASTLGQRHPIDGAMPLVAFMTCLSGLGVAQLLESPVKWMRFTAVALLVLIPVQFFFFL
jgi:hypothetical protein